MAKVLNISEDALGHLLPSSVSLPFRFIWRCRFLLGEGKRRRLLRKAATEWIKYGGYQSCDYFYNYDLNTTLGEEMVVVTIEKRPVIKHG